MSFTVSREEYVLPLKSCGQDDLSRVGGKAVGLGGLLAHGFPVPDGFAITTHGYRRCVRLLASDIEAALVDAGTPGGYHAASEKIHALFATAELAEDVAGAIETAYNELGDDVPVAVRSSATAEDADDASFAGQQDSFLWVVGVEDVARHVIRCWASLFTDRAIAYRARLRSDFADLAMGVVVQAMVPAEAAGVMMTLDPVTGDRNEICIEAALGLGEAIVRGEVSPDRFTVEKASMSLRVETIAGKAGAYRFDPAEGAVRFGELTGESRHEPSLSRSEAVELARLGEAVERAFAKPMDIEWAIDDARRIFLLQARPETVWSPLPAPPSLTDADDPLMCRSPAGTHWSRANVGEAVPGVLSPLNWALWGEVGERTTRGAAYALGALSAGEARAPEDPSEGVLRAFYGRFAIQAEFMGTLGDRVPGTTGQEVVISMLGSVPEGMTFNPTRRRYPMVAYRSAKSFFGFPRAARRLQQKFDDWWEPSVRRADSMSLAEAQVLFRDARTTFEEALLLQSVAFLVVVQPVHDALARLCERRDVEDISALSGTGHAEIDVVADIWRASRNEIPIEEVIRKHGFHGPMEGEIASQVWRLDDAPLRRLIAQYATQDESQDPRLAERRRAEDRQRVIDDLIARTPWHQRPALHVLLHLGRTRIPMRGVVKRNFLQGLDVCRAAARRIGQHRVELGELDAVEDVFFLNTHELLSPALAGDIKYQVAARKSRWEAHQRLDLAGDWTEQPVARHRDAADAERRDARLTAGESLTGVGVSRGIVEGRVRVLMEPDFASVHPGEILVAPVTDPSWSSVMFISKGLVVDIGGALSHAAVVARELGIPCAVNTCVGTAALRTGDLVRIDGGTGVIEVLETVAD